MKKGIVFLILVVLTLGMVCYATESTDYVVGDDDYGESDSVISMDDYDDFYGAYNNGESQEELREYFRSFLDYSREQDAAAKTSTTVKAKVLDTRKVTTTYAMDYYNPYKISAQPITVEILEGEYTGKIIDMQYLLTVDTYENINIPKVKVGDIIYVIPETNEETNELGAYTGSQDSRVSRFSMIAILIVIITALVCIVGKMKGLKTVLLVALIFDLVFVVTMPFIMQDNSKIVLQSGDDKFPTNEAITADTSISVLKTDANGNPTEVAMYKKSNLSIVIMIIDIVVISAVNLINQLGLSKRTLKAFGITMCLLVVVGLLVGGINAITKMSGGTFEAISMAENIVNKNIDFQAIYIFSILLMSCIAMTNVVSKVMLEYGKESYKEESRSYLMGQVGTIAAICLALLLARVITLLVFRYGTKELINSEMLLLELNRMLLLTLSLIGAMPVTEWICSKKKDEK